MNKVVVGSLGLAMLTGLLAAPVQAKASKPGEAMFAEKCAPCHQADGSGTPGTVPALKGSIGGYAGSDAGHRFLGQILVTGMTGPIVSQTKKFSGVMPPFEKLTDKEITTVLRYVLVALNGVEPLKAASTLTESSVAAARTSGGTSVSIRQLRTQAIEAAK